MFSRISLCFLFVISVSFALSAQSENEVRVNGRFLVDSVKIGELVPYSMTASYPSHLNLVFPDSTFSFAPFEFSKKKYFQTKTTDKVSFDSAVYYLTTFEIDSIQTLQLPAFQIHEKDCTAVFAKIDTVFFKNLVTQKLDSIEAPALPLKTNTAYQNVKWLLDYPLLLAIGGVLLMGVILVWIVFGKRIKAFFRKRRLSKNHEAFLTKFTSTVSQLSSDFSSKKAETTALLWKNYMEKLNEVPYTKFTSREIINKEKDEPLGNALHLIDRMIYGGSSYSAESFDTLRSFANNQFNQKLKEINRG